MEGLSYDTIWFGTTLGRKPVIKQHSLKTRMAALIFYLNEGVSPGFYAIFIKINSAGRSSIIIIWPLTGEQGDFDVLCSLSDVWVHCNFKKNPEK